MTPMPAGHILWLFFALIGLSLAQQGPEFGQENFGHSWKNLGPWYLNDTIFDGFLDHPNATTNVPLPGPNATNTSPTGAGAKEDWSWSIAVTDDIPLANATRNYHTGFNYTEDERSKFFTGSRVRLHYPPMLSAPKNGTLNRTYDDWVLGIITWDYSKIYNVSYPDKFRQDDGSCTSIVSEQCVRDIESYVLANYHPSTAQYDCPMVQDLPSCDQTSLFRKVGCVCKTYNATDVAKWPPGHFDVYSYGGELHDRGNVTAYNMTGSLSWATMLLWGSWPTEPYSGHPNALVQINTTAKLTCLRAKDASVGSVTPGWNSAGSRGYSTSSLTSSVFVGVTLLVVWLW